MKGRRRSSTLTITEHLTDVLFLGTPAENYDDMLTKGRHVSSQAARTHCPQGHEYDEANTYTWSGHRCCRACHKASEQRRKAKRLAATA